MLARSLGGVISMAHNPAPRYRPPLVGLADVLPGCDKRDCIQERPPRDHLVAAVSCQTAGRAMERSRRTSVCGIRARSCRENRPSGTVESRALCERTSVSGREPALFPLDLVDPRLAQVRMRLRSVIPEGASCDAADQWCHRLRHSRAGGLETTSSITTGLLGGISAALVPAATPSGGSTAVSCP